MGEILFLNTNFIHRFTLYKLNMIFLLKISLFLWNGLLYMQCTLISKFILNFYKLLSEIVPISLMIKAVLVYLSD